MGQPNKYGNRRILKDGIDHGTTAGYWRHKNRGIEMCEECREAWNQHCSQYRFETGRTNEEKKYGDRKRKVPRKPRPPSKPSKPRQPRITDDTSKPRFRKTL